MHSSFSKSMMQLAICAAIALNLFSVDSYASQSLERGVADLYYVTGQAVSLYRDVEQTKPYLRLRFREPVAVVSSEGSVKQVRTMDGALGYVDADEISNIWILVSKRRKQVILHQGMRVLSEFRADFGYNAYSDKNIRGSEEDPDQWRTPEGVFYVVKKNPYSKFYRAFLLNYPNAEDAERGKRDGLISQKDYEAIMLAEKRGTPPPMGTILGGFIEIHGNGTGLASNWTEGCVAVRDEDMDFMWSYVREGTPVVIEK
ncbi:MAG: murein L,D-transpeptidase [Rhodothermaceae bacterium]|nr:murein L,D-transpeptidase [Rhodothermaceae bacterium]MXW32088.1 murein L,D-transpeptidase [Rhodothermaceae bacterium]MXX97744.1 murein L,D-transpeptidase [Rhodothermaceae bacterium]MXZ18144.1 murein L,D-transpeptidase [Rhodothermaceae bacterium]MXZ57829.1 murein L,D-transpeptidase [Rhodothermaceae bacterium]